ncbi:MAG: CoA-binding protein [Syntrophobacterales bacterium]|nr:CoA-binding protein [Syntrophobacterales bacterium]
MAADTQETWHSTPEIIRRILTDYRVVAVVGLSPQPDRPSHQVARYLKEHGYRIVPVRPGCSEILGERCYPSLKDVPFPVEVVDIFRNVEAIPGVVEEALQVGAKAVWMQLGLAEPIAGAKARDAGMLVVMDRCMKIEHSRLAEQQ